MTERRRVAVLASGGLDSCLLCAELAEEAYVAPIYITMGLAWEVEERRALEAFLAALGHPRIQAPVVLEAPAAPLYGDHWSLHGRGIPGANAPDIEVFLPGRNILLLGLCAVWCSTHEFTEIAIGSLDENPFPDATPAFFRDYARILSVGLGRDVTIVAPFRGLHKEDIIRRFAHLPLELSITCMRSVEHLHCGACNKCRERQLAFERAGVPDRTRYAV